MRRPPPASAASLIRPVGTLIRRHGLLAPGERGVVAVSGGVDSACLLHCLHALASSLDLRLHVAYVHHGLRAAADDEAVFVAELAASYGLPCAVLRADVAALRKGRSPQDAARIARYAALRAHAAAVGATALLTGHNEDDQAETVLLHLLRGSGLDGLAGMRLRETDIDGGGVPGQRGSEDRHPIRPGAPPSAGGRTQIVRPLLRTSRAAIDAHCRAYGLIWREDPSNASRAYRRNAVRLDLLPALEAYNPRIRAALARTAATLALDAGYLRAQAAEALDNLIVEAAAGQGSAHVSSVVVGLRLDRARYAALPAALRLHTLRLALERLLGGTAGFTQEHLTVIDELGCEERSGSRASLPRRLRIEARAGVLRLSVGEQRAADRAQAGGGARGEGRARPSGGTLAPDDAPEDPAHDAPDAGEVPLPVPGIARFGLWRIEAAVMPVEAALSGDPHGMPPGATGELTVYCDRGIGTALAVRGRRPGDRLRPIGLGGSKKLQDVLVDRKVPREERDQVPLVVGPGGIAWVVGHALGEQARLATGATEVLRLHASALTGIDAEGGL